MARLASSRPTDEEIEAFRRDGVACLRGVFDAPWLELLAAGVERNRRAPGPNASENGEAGAPGGFWDDLHGWPRIDEYRRFLFDSPAAALAGALVDAGTVRVFHDHVLIKEPGTAARTPWHQDAPYYCVDGEQTVSLWIPLDPVPLASAVRFIAGSHATGALYAPVSWSAQDNDYSASGLRPLPPLDDDATGHDVRAWATAPGDCIAFHFRTIHGAPGNASTTLRRRAFSARWIGDDVVLARRAAPTSPTFPGLEIVAGAKPPEHTFPIAWSRSCG